MQNVIIIFDEYYIIGKIKPINFTYMMLYEKSAFLKDLLLRALF